MADITLVNLIEVLNKHPEALTVDETPEAALYINTAIKDIPFSHNEVFHLECGKTLVLDVGDNGKVIGIEIV